MHCLLGARSRHLDSLTIILSPPPPPPPPGLRFTSRLFQGIVECLWHLCSPMNGAAAMLEYTQAADGIIGTCSATRALPIKSATSQSLLQIEAPISSCCFLLISFSSLLHFWPMHGDCMPSCHSDMTTLHVMIGTPPGLKVQ